MTVPVSPARSACGPASSATPTAGRRPLLFLGLPYVGRDVDGRARGLVKAAGRHRPAVADLVVHRPI